MAWTDGHQRRKVNHADQGWNSDSTARRRTRGPAKQLKQGVLVIRLSPELFNISLSEMGPVRYNRRERFLVDPWQRSSHGVDQLRCWRESGFMP